MLVRLQNKESESADVIERLNEIPSQFSSDPVQFAYVEPDQVQDLFSDDRNIVLIKTKKKKVLEFSGNHNSNDEIVTFLSDAIGGGGSWKSLKSLTGNDGLVFADDVVIKGQTDEL